MSKFIKSFGIFQEDTNLKIAEVNASGEEVTIKDLQMIALEVTDPTGAAQETPLEEALEGLEFDFDFEENSGQELPKEEKSLDDIGSLTGDETDKDESTYDHQRSLEDLYREMQFEKGTISLNLDFNNVVYKDLHVPEKTGKKKLNAIMKQEFFGDDPPRVSTLSHIRRSDGSYVGVLHRKNMELLETLIMLNRSMSKKRFHYSYIQTNEFALLNALRYNYFDIREDEISAVIYIGKDNTQVMLTKGYDFFTDLPVINEGYESADIINTVIRRIMLERSQLGIEAIQRFYIAGGELEDSMLETVKDHDPSAKVEYLLPLRLMGRDVASDGSNIYADKYDEKTLASYIIPIMLAVVAAQPKETFLIRANFLTKQLREQQNIFSISTEGFIALGLTLIAALIGTNMAFQQQADNRNVHVENTKISSQIRVEQTKLDSIFAIERKIEELGRNIARSNEFIGDKNQWHFIFEELSKILRVSPLSWLKSIASNDDDGFVIQGYTTDRSNIIDFSTRFPDSVIKHFIREEIEGQQVWSFEISFGMPDPIETHRINYERESKR